MRERERERERAILERARSKISPTGRFCDERAARRRDVGPEKAKYDQISVSKYNSNIDVKYLLRIIQ